MMKASRLILLLITTSLLIITSNLNWYSNHWTDFLESDAKGYYSYLPAVFIYEDLHFGFFDEIEREKYSNAAEVYDYRENYEGIHINKYYCGTALVCSPFFLTAHWLSYLYGYEQDGYSYFYMVCLTLAAVFYCFLGMFFIGRLMALYEINEKLISITLIAVLFGSNLFYYTVGELGMSHVYSFAFVSAFLYYARLWFIKNKQKSFIIMSILIGLIVLIRPVNGIIIFALPFIAGSQSTLFKSIQSLLKEKITLLISLIIFMLIISMQLIIYKIQTGSFFIYSYQEEGFNFTDPQIMNFLFSYQKGLFVYTPLYLLALLGLIPIYRSSKFQFLAVFGFLGLITYIMSSWWCWFYGGSFSTRVFVEMLPLFALLMGIALKSIQGWAFRGYATIIIAIIILCQIQTFQYRYYEIHWAHMTKEKYWDVFLRIDKLLEK